VSKSLGPDLRVALVAGDENTVARVEARQNLGIRWVSGILQQLVAALWRDRSVHKLLTRAACEYSERRATLIRALSAHGIEAHGVSGLNVWIPVREETTVAQALLQRGWAVTAGERYRINTPQAIRVTISAMSESDAARFAKDLAAIVQPGRRSSIA
jgi:DNA-binding transcriptional MocR family regulator